ncbi:hypothetical protein D3C83_159420 [compost metagenome]
MLVPDIDHATSLLGHSRAPVHVRIAQQRKTGAHALLDEGLGKDIVDTWFGFTRHRCDSSRLVFIARRKRTERTSAGG